MLEFDLTVALTVHSETVMSGPTIRSALAATEEAKRAGFNIEKIIGFDTPTDGCLEYFSQENTADWKKFRYDYGDQGKTRNSLAIEAKGRYIAYLDGDDLYSENWLCEAIKLMNIGEKAGKNYIVHPELNWGFDADRFVFTKPDQRDKMFTPYYFSVKNYYDALAVASKSTYLEYPFADRAIKKGFAYEDWQWAIETMAAGLIHVVANDTIIFKRRRDASQTIESSSKAACIRSIEAMAVDRLFRLGK